MAEEGKGVAMAILGIVAVIAVVGLVLLFTGATGKWVAGGPGNPNLYTRQSVIDYYSPEGESPYDYYEYETYRGVAQSRAAVGDYTAGGGNWGEVYGESDRDAATEPGDYFAGSDPYYYQVTDDRAPSSIPSDDTTGFCEKGEIYQPNSRRVPATWEPGSKPDCYKPIAHA